MTASCPLCLQERWQQRAQQLMQRYESVDKHEYTRVQTELKVGEHVGECRGQEGMIKIGAMCGLGLICMPGLVSPPLQCRKLELASALS